MQRLHATRPQTPEVRKVLLEVSGLSKRFGPLGALERVDLRVLAGEVHCLLGENGAGKSTLCNVLFGVHRADAGHIRFLGQDYRPRRPADALAAGIAMVHQHFSLVPTLTVIENLMLGRSNLLLRRDVAARKIRSVSADYGFEVNPNAVISELSVGERQRVEIVKCLLRDPRMLLLDEPTAILPPDEVATLLEVCRRIADGGRAVILVTHKLAEIARVADRVTIMRAGQVVQRVDEMATTDPRSLVRAMVGRDITTLQGELAATLGVDPAAPVRAGQAAAHTRRQDAARDALAVEGLSVVDRYGAVKLNEFSLSVRPGEIVGLAGVEGNGQSELGAVLAGLLRPSAGRVRVGGRDVTGRSPREITEAGAGIVPEDRHAVACVGAMSVAENLFLGRFGAMARWGLLHRGEMRDAAAKLLQRFDVRGGGPDVPFETLSGGNQQKAVLARELNIDPMVFLLAAQPTRGLDVGAVEAVYARIREACHRGAGVLLVSSELDELIAVSHRVVVIYRGRVMGETDAAPGRREAIGAMMSGHRP
jgi:simple sugar transport system ATP-binding protein